MTNQEAHTLLERVGRRSVRSVARDHGQTAEALFHVAAGDQRQWLLSDWTELLGELDSQDASVADWLSLRA